MNFEILVDKAFDVTIGFVLGILIITLHRRADRFDKLRLKIFIIK